MDTVANLTSIVQREVEDYGNVRVWKGKSYTITDHQRHIYAVVDVPDLPRKSPPHIVVMARVVDDKVMIEHDITDRPLVEELVRAGIPRDNIVLVYAGETLQSATPEA